MVARLLAAVFTLAPLTPALGQFGGAITIDDQPTAEQKLTEINDLRRAERYDDAVELVQELVDGSRFKLVSVGDGKYIDAERWVRRELVRDPALQVAYRKRFTAEAERVVGEAVRARDMMLLRDAYRRYAVTRPGLEAGMVLTGLLLESGDTAAAWSLSLELLDHPDAYEVQPRLLSLHGSAGALMGDGALVDEVSKKLRGSDQTEAADALVALAAAVTDPMTGWSRPVVDAGPAPTALDVPLWSEPMARRGTELPSVRQKVDELRVLPVASRDVIFVNTTRQVLAMDRAAGPVLWAYPDQANGQPGDFSSSQRSNWPDTRGVALAGGRLFALLGECDGLSGNMRDDIVPNRLVCLDRSSGSELWTRMAGELAEGEPTMFDDRRGERVNLQQTHFVGTPIVADGQVLVMLRRASQLGVQTNWLLAFDAATGELQWLRHLALAQVMQGSGSNFVAPQIALAGDTLYVTDSIGVVAAIDPRSGAYQWLTVVADENLTRVNLKTEGVLSPPVLTRSGLVVALASTSDRLLLLDPEDGTLLDDLGDDAGLIGARYILDAAGDVLVVTHDGVALWDGEQGTVLWQTPHESENELRGRGDVARQFAVIPTLSGARVLNLADGQVVGKIEGTSGNVTVLDEEVLVTSGGQLHSYMSWDRAYDRLVRRIEQRPNDPDAGLALASLALRQGGRRDAVIQGVDYAMAAVDRLAGPQADAAGQRVFDRLRDLSSETREADADLRLQLYDRLALASRSASQEVAYHLDFGRYLVSIDQPRLAVEHFQAVMVDPAFAIQGYLLAGQNQPAGATAQRELERLVREHGRSVYARFDALAWQRLEMLSARPDARPADFALIAQRYPLSEAASPALLAAAKVLARQDQPFGELSYCQQAVARAMNDQQRDAALGAMLQVHLRSSSRQEAQHVVRWVQRQFPDSRPIREEQPTDLSSWLAAADALENQTADQLTIPNELSAALRFEGRLLHLAPGLDRAATDPSRFYLLSDGKLRRVDVDQPRAPRWEVDIAVDDGPLYLLADGRGQVLLWSVQVRKLIALDAETGRPLWNRPAELMELDHGTDTVQRALGNDLNLPGVVVSPTVICFADRNGLVLAIDRYLGSPLWQYRLGLARVTALAVDGWTLAVAGIDGPETQLNHGRVLLLDLLTGEARLDQIDLHVGFAPSNLAIDDGKLVVAGGTRAACFSLEQGNQLWNSTVLSRPSSGAFALAGGVLALEADDGMVHLFDVNAGGKLLGMHDIGDAQTRYRQPNISRTLLVADAGQVLLASPRAVAGLSNTPGGLAWRDALANDEQTLYGMALSTDQIAVLCSPAQNGPDPDRILPVDNLVRFSICTFDRQDGRLIGTTPIGPIADQPDPTGLRAVQGGLLLPMGPTTLLLTTEESPAPANQPR